MGDQISRTETAEYLKSVLLEAARLSVGKEAELFAHIANKSVDEWLNAVPAVDAAPVVHGRWVYKERHRSSYRLVNGYDAMGEMHSIMVHEESDGKEPYCARCGAAAAESFMDYCPRCGAKMDMEEED